MIRELHVKNLALIQDITVEFDTGFSVFTGETGAGKSILIGAIGLLLGDRASTESVRSGADEAEICGVFELTTNARDLVNLLKQNNIEIDNSELIIRRKISTHGKSRIYLNQVPIPLTLLKKAGDLLIDFHSQHEHQSLLQPETALVIVDSLPKIAVLRDEYQKAFKAYDTACKALGYHNRAAAALKERRDVLEFQFNELNSLNLRAGEEEELEAELKLISSSTERTQLASEILEILNGTTSSLGKSFSTIKKKLENLSRYDQSASQWTSDIDSAQSLISELETFCESYGESAQGNTDPARIEFINERIARIQRLKKKYSCTLSELIAKENQLKSDLYSIENIDADREMLEKQVESTKKEGIQKGISLRNVRKKAAAQFDKQISAQMEKLGFSGGEWKTEFVNLDDLTASGMDEISFLVKTNPGEPVLPLTKIASGGEISRLMLAIKTIMAEKDQIPVLIFDEIDVGIGGVLAKEVAQSLKNLSTSHQVICISHLHQIASVSDHHFHVYKEITSDRTVTRINRLEGNQKVEEIARMFGDDTQISRKHAQELLRRK